MISWAISWAISWVISWVINQATNQSTSSNILVDEGSQVWFINIISKMTDRKFLYHLKRIERIMKKNGIKSQVARKFKVSVMFLESLRKDKNLRVICV